MVGKDTYCPALVGCFSKEIDVYTLFLLQTIVWMKSALSNYHEVAIEQNLKHMTLTRW